MAAASARSFGRTTVPERTNTNAAPTASGRHAGQLRPREAVDGQLQLVGLVARRGLPVHDLPVLARGRVGGGREDRVDPAADQASAEGDSANGTSSPAGVRWA